MAFVRKKEVKWIGSSAFVCPMLSAEAEQYISRYNEMVSPGPDVSAEEKTKALLDLTFQTVVTGLNKAYPDRKPQFDSTNLHEEFDKEQIEDLYNEILNTSRIKIGATARGEAQAP